MSIGLTVRRRGSEEAKDVQTSTEWILRGVRRTEEKYHTNHDLHIQEMSKVHSFFPSDDYMLSFHRFVYMLLSSILSFKSHCPRCPRQRAAVLIPFDGRSRALRKPVLADYQHRTGKHIDTAHRTTYLPV